MKPFTADLLSKPVNSRIQFLKTSPSQVTLVIPSGDHWAAATGLGIIGGFFSLIAIGTALYILCRGVLGHGWGDSHAWGGPLISGFSGALFGGGAWCLLPRPITITADSLTLTRTRRGVSWFGVIKQQCARGYVMRIDARSPVTDPAPGLEGNWNQPLAVVELLGRDESRIRLWSQRAVPETGADVEPIDEVRWVAAVLREALGVPGNDFIT